MYRYLTDKVADYTTTTLSVNSTVGLPQTGDKEQEIHDMDDGSVVVIGISSSNFFTIPVQWTGITALNHDILIDMWHNELKGAGRRRTFYWAHPFDSHIYTVRFMTPLTSSYDEVGNLSVSPVTLRVEGNKP